VTAALIPLASRLPATMPRLPEGETARFIDEGSESAYRGGLGEGHAVFVFNDGKTFKGGWKDNEQEGYGVMQYPEKNGTTPKYDGEWKDGKKHGAGTYTWASDSVYEGEWKDGKKHGKGKYKMYSGNVYEGDFVENKWEGKGKYTIVQPGSLLLEYEGEWKDNRRVGVGRCRYSNGDIEICRYEDVKFGHARPVRKGKGVRWVSEGPAAFSGPGMECLLAVLISAADAGIEVDEKAKFQLIKHTADGKVASTTGGAAKGWDNKVVLKLQEGAAGFEKMSYFVNRRRQAMLLQDGKATDEISMEEARAIAKEFGMEPPDDPVAV